MGNYDPDYAAAFVKSMGDLIARLPDGPIKRDLQFAKCRIERQGSYVSAGDRKLLAVGRRAAEGG